MSEQEQWRGNGWVSPTELGQCGAEAEDCTTTGHITQFKHSEKGEASPWAAL